MWEVLLTGKDCRAPVEASMTSRPSVQTKPCSLPEVMTGTTVSYGRTCIVTLGTEDMTCCTTLGLTSIRPSHSATVR